MFSQSSFRSLAQGGNGTESNKQDSSPKSAPTTLTPSESSVTTPTTTTPGKIDLSNLRPPFQSIEPHESPFHEDEFDLEDPHFEASRSSSRQGLNDLAGSVRGGSFRDKRLDTIEQEELPKTHDQQISSPQRRSTGRNMEPSSPQSIHLKNKLSASPSRPHLNALSPLQTFSPLQPINRSSTPSEAGSGLSRAGSLTRSLSRKQSLYANAAKWAQTHGSGVDYEDDNLASPTSLFSRLTLVKAPAESAGLKQRSKSSSSLTPFTSMSLNNAQPATSDRGPRRSFAAASFAGFTPMTHSRSSSMTDMTHRLQTLQSDVQNKHLSPEEVFEIAQGLMSPVAMPEGGFKGSELKRRKSAGASIRRSSKSGDPSPTKPPVALEPVEYVQLDDDTLLPYVERPAEVNELLEHPSNEKMLTQLKAAFPKTSARDHWQALSPEEWNWDELLRHLALSRIECPDYAWIFRARQAIRKRSVALWEKVGVGLGCDADLLNAGGEDGLPSSWAGLSLGEEGEYDPSDNHVYIEALEAVDPAEAERAERELTAAFGDIVEDEGEQAAAGMAAMHEMEEEEEGPGNLPTRQTPAQRAGNQSKIDPMTSPSMQYRGLGHARSPSSPTTKSVRSKSFVGLQIMTSHAHSQSNSSYSISGSSYVRSPGGLGSMTPVLGTPGSPAHMGMGMGLTMANGGGQQQRGPDAPLFPSSFSSLSVEPNLGRSASIGIPGMPGQGMTPGVGMNIDMGGGRRWSTLGRKASGTGLSESAITFGSESDYAHSSASVVGRDHDTHA